MNRFASTVKQSKNFEFYNTSFKILIRDVQFCSFSNHFLTKHGMNQ